jgi:Ca2+/Na+ antiporter
MASGSWVLLFAAGVVVSLAASWVLVSRLERLGDRAGLPEAWLGLVAALAADAPEITSAVTALTHGQIPAQERLPVTLRKSRQPGRD